MQCGDVLVEGVERTVVYQDVVGNVEPLFARSASATWIPNAAKRRSTSLLPEATPPVSPMT